jgi:hypothetical protein
MTDKDLIVKLNSLKNISPDKNWTSQNRELLLSQISNSGARELPAWKVFVINLNSFAKAASKPAYALGAFVLILITGSLFSHQVFSSAKPNDSLYIARIISEKAKLNIMFNSEERNKLAVQFATEHAQDISAVLADPQFNNDSNKDQVAKLNESFNKEIDSVKTHISYLSPKVSKDNTKAEVADTVSMANSEKDNNGVQLFEDKNLNQNQTPAAKATSVLSMPANLLASSATATLPIKKVETNKETEEKKAVSADIILDEAKQLFENKDYNKAADKLKEVDEIIKN